MSREMGINESSLRRIICKLGLKAYKKNKCQKLTDVQKEKSKERSRELFRRFGNGRHLRTLFTDEKLFTVEKVVNRQNDRVYAVSNPHATVGRSSHLGSVMVFAGITTDGKTPLWFVPEGTKASSRNHLELLEDKLLPWANSHFGNRFWTFQQDGAPARRSTTVQQWCKENFPDVIAFNEWPAYSPDLNPMDYNLERLRYTVSKHAFHQVRLDRAVLERRRTIVSEHQRDKQEPLPNRQVYPAYRTSKES
ncbi:unnamed protein product [Haemonchus placei]|uniref:DDE_3 domain-containing protein n=1 Tax=Haemonchus placei TaxID=6290 RepID=A0A0N4WD93_HAEPC|nr:unnamed protein product [Haemonchus placei]